MSQDATTRAPGEAPPPTFIGPITGQDIAAYAKASSDPNAIHLDLALAKQFGFPGRPVHGMRVLAGFEPLILAAFQGAEIIAIDALFLTPIMEDDIAKFAIKTLKITENEGRRTALLRIIAYTPANLPALRGEATILLP